MNVMENIALFSDRLKIICELSDDSSDRQAIFHSLRNLGFRAYAIENDYREEYYFKWLRPNNPIEMLDVPTHQCDIIFSKSELGNIFS